MATTNNTLAIESHLLVAQYIEYLRITIQHPDSLVALTPLWFVSRLPECPLLTVGARAGLKHVTALDDVEREVGLDLLAPLLEWVARRQTEDAHELQRKPQRQQALVQLLRELHTHLVARVLSTQTRVVTQ